MKKKETKSQSGSEEEGKKGERSSSTNLLPGKERERELSKGRNQGLPACLSPTVPLSPLIFWPLQIKGASENKERGG